MPTLKRNAAAMAAAATATAIAAVAPLAPASAQTPGATPPVKLASVKPEKLDFKVNTLKNGLKVITLEDHTAPVVTVQVWYRVGSAEEPKGKGGFAHLFEHLMFKGSENVGPEQHSRYVEQLGASYNADTSFDRTRYYETVPSNALERILFLEADRMASLRVDEANLKSERDVVKEEYRLRVANSPYGSLLTNVLAQVFPEGDPYAHPTIGSIPDLDAAQLAEVQAFHKDYYRPDNATLVLVGDFKTADALKMVEKYFGRIPKSPDGAFKRIAPTPDTQEKATRAVHYDKLAPLPAVGLAYRLPAAKDPDIPALDVISQILSAGQSSRLYRSLVRDKQLAVQASGGGLGLRYGGLYFFFAIASPGKPPKDVEAALLSEVERLKAEKVSEAELVKAKNQVLNDRVFGLVSTEGKANALGEADLLYDDPGEVNRALEKIQRVTADDIQRVARKYFANGRENVFYVLPESMKQQAGEGGAAQ
jgi:Predicted Zn-dependent peptidases